MRRLLIILLLQGCTATLPPPPRSIPEPVARPVIEPVQTIEPEPEVTPPLTRATLPVPPAPRSEAVSDDNPYVGAAGPPKARPPRNFPVPSMAIPKR